MLKLRCQHSARRACKISSDESLPKFGSSKPAPKVVETLVPMSALKGQKINLYTGQLKLKSATSRKQSLKTHPPLIFYPTLPCFTALCQLPYAVRGWSEASALWLQHCTWKWLPGFNVSTHFVKDYMTNLGVAWGLPACPKPNTYCAKHWNHGPNKTSATPAR